MAATTSVAQAMEALTLSKTKELKGVREHFEFVLGSGLMFSNYLLLD